MTQSGFTGPAFGGPFGYVESSGDFTNIMLVKNTATNPLGPRFHVGAAAQPWYLVVKYDAPSTYTWLRPSAVADSHAILEPSTTANRFFGFGFGGYIVYVQSGGNVWIISEDGTIATPTDLSAAVFGRPTVYYGKLFLTLASDKTTIVWSEENDPDIGYQAVGYDNFWTLRQTSSDSITGLCGTNEYLLVFRQGSVTSITGAVNSDFRAAGTLEGISQKIGTLSPDTICVVENSVWFLDQFARPHKVEAGRGLVPLWPNAKQSMLTADLTTATQFGNWGRYVPETEVVIFRVMMQSGSAKLFAFSSRTEEFLGEWTIGSDVTLPYGNTGFDSTGREMLTVNLNGTNFPLTNFVTQKADTATDQRDEMVAATSSPTVSIETPKMYGDMDRAMNLSDVTVSSQRLSNVQAAIYYKYKGSPTGNQSYSTAVLMDQAAVADAQPSRAVAGLKFNQTRWAQLQFGNTIFAGAASETKRFTLGQVRIKGTTQRVSPKLP